MIPTSLYIHLPWCIKKCPYCDFNAHPLKQDTHFGQYIDRLVEDLHTHADILSTRPLHSIFIGGGTPSLFSATELSPIFTALRQYQQIDDIEITIEANPGTQDAGYYSGYRELGINRISIGGQSFNSQMLTQLGRIHNGEKTHQAILQAQSAGFDRVNLDIMYGLPQQTTEQAIEDLQRFLSYKLEHLSWYQLNIEANTLFAVTKPQLPSDETIDEMDRIGSELLTDNGFNQYEISAWTQNLPSQHNLNYWHFGDYLGIGCGAHSKITTPAPFTATRTIKHKHPNQYLQNLIQHQETISESDMILEYCINHFRTNQPLELALFEQRSGLDKSNLIAKLKNAESQGLVTLSPHKVTLTKLGFHHHNSLCLSLA